MDTKVIMAKKGKVCCPRLKKRDWEKRTWKWDDKKFYKKHYFSIFHMPINLGSVLTKSCEMLSQKRLLPRGDPIMLCRNENFWGGDIYIEVVRDSKSVPLEGISGKFITKLFEGQYKEARMWLMAMNAWCKAKGYDVEEIMAFYGTCPKCTKKYGSAQTVLFAKIE